MEVNIPGFFGVVHLGLCTRGFTCSVFEDAHRSRGLRVCIHMGEIAGVVSICVVLCNLKKDEDGYASFSLQVEKR